MAIHAHRCKACAEKGEQVIWMHTEACKGVVAAHTCPKCGSSQKENWQQFLVEPGKLPQQNAGKSTANFETILGYVILIIGIAAMAYAVYYVVQGRKHGNEALPNLS